jgi:hypothetical protein
MPIAQAGSEIAEAESATDEHFFIFIGALRGNEWSTAPYRRFLSRF